MKKASKRITPTVTTLLFDLILFIKYNNQYYATSKIINDLFFRNTSASCILKVAREHEYVDEQDKEDQDNSVNSLWTVNGDTLVTLKQKLSAQEIRKLGVSKHARHLELLNMRFLHDWLKCHKRSKEWIDELPKDCPAIPKQYINCDK